jgi:hypothetical protein
MNEKKYFFIYYKNGIQGKKALALKRAISLKP